MCAVAVGERIGPVLQPADENLEFVDGLVELVPVLDRGVQHGVQVGDHLADRLVAFGQAIGELRGLVEDVVDGAALALEDGDDRRGDAVDLLRIQRPEQRLEATDQRVEVQRRLGACQRDESAWRQGAFSALPGPSAEFQVPVADEVLVADLRGRRLIELHRAVDGEVDADPLVSLDQVDFFDLADFYAGGADELAGT